MEDQLRPGVCYWHSFAWDGRDMFGIGTLDRPWFDDADEMAGARSRMAAAFEFFAKLGTPYYCFHDRDVAPEGDSFAEFRDNLDALTDDALGYQERTGARLLWGTANLFTHPRYQAGAATNPDPEVFAYAAAQVKHMLEVTHRLGGENYVLWGGREGYDTLLNTDLRREQAQLARFLHLVAEHKAKIGFGGQLLIEPKPQEPTKHQYDYDVSTVYGFLVSHGLENDYKVNIEANHATLAGHSFHHEVAFAAANGILGSIDANRGDPQNGWDTDQFPNSVDDLVMPMYEILRNGGLGSGGFNFDAKLRRQSTDRSDLFHAHVGGLDTLARSLLAAASLVEDGSLQELREARYAGWSSDLGGAILDGGESLASLEARVASGEIAPVRASGHQEMLENLVNRHVWRAG
jgi:xylose isomerase